jgi:hypothetical protein
VSEESIRQLAGHVSPRMLARYSHIRVEGRRAAIARWNSHSSRRRLKSRRSPCKSPYSHPMVKSRS